MPQYLRAQTLRTSYPEVQTTAVGWTEEHSKIRFLWCDTLLAAVIGVLASITDGAQLQE